MTLITLLLWLLIICLVLCLLYLAPRVILPLAARLSIVSDDPDGLQNRVFPLLAFLALLCVILKLTIF